MRVRRGQGMERETMTKKAFHRSTIHGNSQILRDGSELRVARGGCRAKAPCRRAPF